MSVDTQIEGSPSSVETAATWLRNDLAAGLESSAEVFNGARRSAEASWEGQAGAEMATTMASARGATDDLERAARTMATDLEAFATALRRCQGDMADVRRVAAAAGLSVTGFVVQHPGEGPARPPDDFVGTDAEVAAHDRRVVAYDAHQDLLRAYVAAQTEAARVDRAYASACRALQDDYTVTRARVVADQHRRDHR